MPRQLADALLFQLGWVQLCAKDSLWLPHALIRAAAEIGREFEWGEADCLSERRGMVHGVSLGRIRAASCSAGRSFLPHRWGC